MIEKGHATHVPHLETPWACPRTWRRQTVWVMGNGPSLAGMDLEPLVGRNVIAVNGSVFIKPGLAKMLFFGDSIWYWENKPALRDIGIPMVTVSRYYVDDNGHRREQPCHEEDGVLAMRQTRSRGMSDSADTLAWNQSSGGTAIDLAAHMGANRIILIGFDMCFGADGERNAVPYRRRVSGKLDAMNNAETWRRVYDAARKRKIGIFNATVGGKLRVFPRIRYEDALS